MTDQTKANRGDRRPKKAAGHTLQHNSDEDQRQARPKCEYQGTDDHNARPDCAITARLERTLSNTSPPGSWLSNAATLAISLGLVGHAALAERLGRNQRA